MKKYLSWKLFAILIVTLFLGFFDLPGNVQSKILPFTPDSITKTKVNLGLDLQGGSQLDFKIDLRKVPEADQKSIIEGVQAVIEKRVNRLGVSEPNIYQADIAEETHIIVEIAENANLSQEDVDTYLGNDKLVEELTDDEKKIVSLEKAKATVGKTIQLEFKEEKTTMDLNEQDKVKELANAALDKINNDGSFEVIGQEEQQAFPGKVNYERSEYIFETDLNSSIKDAIANLEIDETTSELIEHAGAFVIGESGQAIQEQSLAIFKLIDVIEEVKNEKEVSASHILLSYKELDAADATVTRTQAEAYELMKEIKSKLDEGESFESLAKEHSDDLSNKENGGKLDRAVTGDGNFVFDFEQASLALEKEGEISDIIETQYGYHLIIANEIKFDITEQKYQYESISYSLTPDPWQDTGLTGEHFVHADVQIDNFFQPYVSIQFNDEGAKLFEELTEKNINKRMAIFVGGELISAPRVNEKISGGSAQITGQFTHDEAKNLARDLNTGAIPAPIVLTGEYTIGATIGQEALNKSLLAGAIGLLIVMLFMLAYYKLPGLAANGALLVYGVILLFLIKSQLPLGVSIIISLIIFAIMISSIVNNNDSGWEKFLSFLLSCVGFFFITFLLKTGVVLTLAGIAGIILSIGMAVDANILIFERLKEELETGKSLQSAINTGFHRAWSAIRDSNFSTLITCAILFYFGSSIIRGFAFNLAAGILVSMFTAITITRTLLYGLAKTKLSSNLASFGIKENKKEKTIKFIEKSKTWFRISTAMVGISIVCIIVFGLNLGIDFKGGTLLEFQFEEKVEKEQLVNTLVEIENEISNGDSVAESPEEASEESDILVEKTASENEVMISADKESIIDLTHIQVIESGEMGYIVKTKYLSSANHDQVVAKMKEKLPNFTEPRFTTIGPTIGKTLLHKAIIAIIFALVVIIVYVSIAFRKIPKEVSSWKFGASAIVALIHDVLIVTGIFVIIGQFMDVEIDALFITAMLTVFGYSVNDTIVVLDRLRENLIHDGSSSLEQNANKSLNQTLARSLNTSISTLITLLAILFFGSDSVFYFVLALAIGTAIGTYSSIFLATPLLVRWNQRAQRKDS